MALVPSNIFANPTMGIRPAATAVKGIFSNPTSLLGGGGNARLEQVIAKTGIANPVGGMFGGSSNTSSQATVQYGSGIPGADWRVKCSVSPQSGLLYKMPKTGIMYPLVATGGVVFPYTPSVTVQHLARYSSQPLTHSNYNNFFYEGSEVQEINITADFTVQNEDDAAYFLAALYFFRAATKMFYGNSGQYQGAPPPIIYLDGYGQHYLPHVPCVVTSFSHTMPADVDYIEIAANGALETTVTSNQTPGPAGINVWGAAGNTMTKPADASASGTTTTTTQKKYKNRIPTYSQFVLAFQPVYSRKAQREFNLEAFARGELITKGYL